MGYTTLEILIKGYATIMWPQNNRILSRFFYSNLIILSSVFRPYDFINTDEYLNPNFRVNRWFWNMFNICLDATIWTSFLTMFWI